MRKLFTLLAIAFLLQSCFTYREFKADPNKMEVGRTYKIKRNNKFQRVKIQAMTNSEVTITTAVRKESIPLSEITEIKSRRFSVVKTAALPVVIVGGLVGLAFIAWQ